jgi:hypothetical protein
MPARLIEDHRDMLVTTDGGGEAVEKLLHCGGVHFGHDECEGSVGAGLNAGENIGECETIAGDARRPLPARPPDAARPSLLSDARFALDEQPQTLVFMRTLSSPSGSPGSFERPLLWPGPSSGDQAAAFAVTCRGDVVCGRPTGMQLFAEPLGTNAGQIFERVGRQSRRLRIASSHDDSDELGLFLDRQRCRLPPPHWSASPSMPWVLYRMTQSRSACRSMPAASATSLRLIPESALAIASNRRATRRFASVFASLRSTSTERSFLIFSADIASSWRINHPAGSRSALMRESEPSQSLRGPALVTRHHVPLRGSVQRDRQG